MSGRENFPVGSLLIRRDLRPVVAAYYAFARAADDAADDPLAAPGAKLAALDRFEAGLDGDPDGAGEGRDLRAALAARGLLGAARHARQLLSAFRWDARGISVATWADLMAYCRDSANPVGRFLLDIHGEGPEGQGPADDLCTALQVLNHLQDLGDDHRRLGRRYLPADWMAAEGAVPADLGAARMGPALRRVADRALDRCDLLLDRAGALPGALASRRLGGESAAILRLARGLSRALRRGNPLAGRIRPSRADFARAGVAGLAWAIRPRRTRGAAPARGPA